MNDAARHVKLAPLAAAAAAGRLDAVAPAARAALEAGCTPAEVRETLRTLAPFVGFPRTLDAFAAARPHLPAAPRGNPTTSVPSRGAAFFDVVYGADAAKVRANVRELDSDVAAWVEEDAYGRALSHPALDPSLRERIAVVLLVAQGLRNQLSGHMRGALNFGATSDELAAFLDAAAPFVAADELAFARTTLARVAAGRNGEGKPS